MEHDFHRNFADTLRGTAKLSITYGITIMKIVKLLTITLVFGALSACGMYSGQASGTLPSQSSPGYYPDSGNGN